MAPRFFLEVEPYFNTPLFLNNQQLLDKINTDTEMDDIIQDYNAVSYVVF